MTEDLGCLPSHTKKQRSDLHWDLTSGNQCSPRSVFPGTQTASTRSTPGKFQFFLNTTTQILREAALVLWACSETGCQVGLVKSCARYRSVRQGWKALALGRSWLISASAPLLWLCSAPSLHHLLRWEKQAGHFSIPHSWERS